MIYFYSSPIVSDMNVYKYNNIQNFLLSFAVDAKAITKFDKVGIKPKRVIIDSGAFSVWNKGGSIDIDDYLNFIKKQNQNWTFISLDVIPKTGSKQKDIDIACEQSLENFKYLKKHVDNVLPVHHFGDNIKFLDKYIEYTNYIGISPANDTHENVKRKYLKMIFNYIPKDLKTHGLGYSSSEGLRLFPFYSVDSISFKKAKIRYNEQASQFWVCTKTLSYYFAQRIKYFKKLETEITQLWESRGYNWK